MNKFVGAVCFVALLAGCASAPPEEPCCAGFVAKQEYVKYFVPEGINTKQYRPTPPVVGGAPSSSLGLSTQWRYPAPPSFPRTIYVRVIRPPKGPF